MHTDVGMLRVNIGKKLKCLVLSWRAHTLFSAMYTAFGIKEVLYVAEIPDGGPHTTPESSRCAQSFTPRSALLQYSNELSFPKHWTLSIHIGPVPFPNDCPFVAAVAWGSPSMRHTTYASSMLQKSSHTVPQTPLTEISTRPSFGELPSVRRTSKADINHG